MQTAQGKRLSAVALLAILIGVSGCATARSIKPIVFQGPGFNPAQYQADLADCYRMVDEQAPGVGSSGTIAATTLGGALLGGVAGTVLGAVAGSPGQGAAMGAAIGGTVGGVGASAATEAEKRQVYYSTVQQCLALKGYTVMGATGRAS